MNKYFLLNLEKIWYRFVLSYLKKTQKTRTLILKNGVTQPKARLL